MQYKSQKSNISLIILTSFVSAALIIIALAIHFCLPVSVPYDTEIRLSTLEASAEKIELPAEDISESLPKQNFLDFYSDYSLAVLNDDLDNGLSLYRQNFSRDAVEWFYFQITGNKDVTQAILKEADKNDIPLSLAFSLAHTESNYNTRAKHNNTNNTVDRGLFQLNSNSFTNLSEEDFFDPFVSAKYGMSHLRFCMNTAGNDVSALAMYNAGTNKVRSNRTPQVTLNYISGILTYQKMLEDLFENQVTSYYETKLSSGLDIAWYDTKH